MLPSFATPNGLRRLGCRSRGNVRHRCATCNASPTSDARSTTAHRRRRHFINLTNGLEAAAALVRLVGVEEVRVTRIQSSHCEAGAYDKLLQGLGPELMWSLATGYECIVYDYASRDTTRGVPRALFLGLQFARWALHTLWYDEAPQSVLVRGMNLVPYWRDEVLPYKVSKRTRKACRYYAPYARALAGGEVRLVGAYGPVTSLDGRYDEYVDMARRVWGDDDGDDDGDGEGEQFGQWLDANALCVHDPDCGADELLRRQIALKSAANTTLP